MLPAVEMLLWAIHHATTLLFGVFASAALCGIEINRRHALELVLVGAVTGCAFGLANAVGGELFARQVYPIVVHLPLVIYLCARYRLSPLLAALGITSAYLSCQFSNWMGIAAFAAAKAMEKLFDRADAERGRFFPMKRAQPHEVGPAFFQRYITPNHIDDIDALEQVLEEGGRNRHGSDCLANRPSAGTLHELKIKK